MAQPGRQGNSVVNGTGFGFDVGHECVEIFAEFESDLLFSHITRLALVGVMSRGISPDAFGVVRNGRRATAVLWCFDCCFHPPKLARARWESRGPVKISARASRSLVPYFRCLGLLGHATIGPISQGPVEGL